MENEGWSVIQNLELDIRIFRLFFVEFHQTNLEFSKIFSRKNLDFSNLPFQAESLLCQQSPTPGEILPLSKRLKNYD